MLKIIPVKMMRIVTSLLLLSAIVAGAETDVQFTFNNAQFNLSQYTNIQVVLQPESINVSGTITLLQPRIYQYTDTNATTIFTNVASSATGSYYRWIVPAFTSADGNNPPVTSQGDILIASGNLGLISSTTVGATFVPVYGGNSAAWTAQASDLRYGALTNGSVQWNTTTNLSGARRATMLWVYPSPPYNYTNHPYAQVFTN